MDPETKGGAGRSWKIRGDRRRQIEILARNLSHATPGATGCTRKTGLAPNGKIDFFVQDNLEDALK